MPPAESINVFNLLSCNFNLSAFSIIHHYREGFEDEYQGEETTIIFESGMLSLKLKFGKYLFQASVSLLAHM